MAETGSGLGLGRLSDVGPARPKINFTILEL